MRPKRGPTPSTNPLAFYYSQLIKAATLHQSLSEATGSVKLPAFASVKLLASASVRLLASAKPLALRHPKALGEASVTALYDVRRLQHSEDPLQETGTLQPGQHRSKST
ncbi:hypothetical protein DPMN_169016 [Dreissena polymorpha]|uniref:Uncharacterized protein n=1 Tax=Dreissena polymorpha TaxID=45954 RepID=A0A9D4F1S9_DREPO|nr:hypothetical protein DPMN_169016 [Dreissena polymorpha]